MHNDSSKGVAARTGATLDTTPWLIGSTSPLTSTRTSSFFSAAYAAPRGRGPADGGVAPTAGGSEGLGGACVEPGHDQRQSGQQRKHAAADLLLRAAEISGSSIVVAAVVRRRAVAAAGVEGCCRMGASLSFETGELRLPCAPPTWRDGCCCWPRPFSRNGSGDGRSEGRAMSERFGSIAMGLIAWIRP